MRTVSQMQFPDIDPSVADSGLASGPSNIVDASPAALVESSDYSPVQAANIISYMSSAEPSSPANKPVNSNADHMTATAESCENGDEHGQSAETAVTVAAMPSVLTNASPSSVAATATVFAQAGNEPMEAGIMTNPLYQTKLHSAAHGSTATHPSSSTLTLHNNKTRPGDCSNAAINITANSSANMSALSTAPPAHPTEIASQLASVTKPAQPVAESGGTISAHYQQRQPVCMRPSKDNIFVAQGFTEVKASGRRTEEEKACGVQRSPESILFKWDQHSSQLVCCTDNPFFVLKLLLSCKAVFLPDLQ